MILNPLHYLLIFMKKDIYVKKIGDCAFRGRYGAGSVVHAVACPGIQGASKCRNPNKMACAVTMYEFAHSRSRGYLYLALLALFSHRTTNEYVYSATKLNSDVAGLRYQCSASRKVQREGSK